MEKDGEWDGRPKRLRLDRSKPLLVIKACFKIRSRHEKTATLSVNHAGMLSFAIIVATLTLSDLY